MIIKVQKKLIQTFTLLPVEEYQNTHFCISTVQVEDSTVTFHGRRLSLRSAARSVPLHVIRLLFKWHLSASASRPTGMASG